MAPGRVAAGMAPGRVAAGLAIPPPMPPTNLIPTVAAIVPLSKSKNGHKINPIGSDLAQNLSPGLVFHEDSESGVKISRFRAKIASKNAKIAQLTWLPL